MSDREKDIIYNYETSAKDLAAAIVRYTEAVSSGENIRIVESFTWLENFHHQRLYAVAAYEWLTIPNP